MARKPRLHVPGGLYHVILRGNARQDVFLTPGDRHFFYELLADGVPRFGYRVNAFCLMTNHLHLALQAGEAGLSAGMQNLSFRYARRFNARLGRTGHVFQGRFKAYLVRSGPLWAGLGTLHPSEPGAREDGSRPGRLPLE